MRRCINKLVTANKLSQKNGRMLDSWSPVKLVQPWERCAARSAYKWCLDCCQETWKIKLASSHSYQPEYCDTRPVRLCYASHLIQWVMSLQLHLRISSSLVSAPPFNSNWFASRPGVSWSGFWTFLLPMTCKEPCSGSHCKVTPRVQWWQRRANLILNQRSAPGSMMCHC